MEENFAKFLIEKLQKDYNSIASFFASQRQKPWPEAEFLVEKYAKEGEKILDLACGSGQWLEFFKKKKIIYFGIDFSEKLIEIAKKRYPKSNFLVGNVTKLPFADEFFDKVYAIALFHHLPSKKLRSQVLNEIKRVLKKDGFLILTVWNLWKNKDAQKLIFKFAFLKILKKTKLDAGDILMNWKGIKDFYFHCFTKKELKKMIFQNGFDIIKIGEFLVGKKQQNSNFYLIARPYSLKDKIRASGA